MKKILFLTNIPSPYRVSFFNEFSKMYDVKVIFERKFSTSRNSEWKSDEPFEFEHVYLKGLKLGTDNLISFGSSRYISKFYDAIFIANPMTPVGIFSILYLRLKKIPYIIEGDGGKKPTKEFWPKRIFKRFVLYGAQCYFSTGIKHSEYYKFYGIKEDLIFQYHFSSVYYNEVSTKLVSEKTRKQIRKELKLRNLPTILFVGQFIFRKGIDILLKNISSKNKEDFQIVLVGGHKDDLSSLGITTVDVNVIVRPFQRKYDLVKYYDAADVFVFTTREDIWGLVLNEAISRGLPVISSNMAGAAYELINNGQNGYIYTNQNHLNKLVHNILFDEEKKENLGINSIKIAKKFTIEKMVEDHDKFLRAL